MKHHLLEDGTRTLFPRNIDLRGINLKIKLPDRSDDEGGPEFHEEIIIYGLNRLCLLISDGVPPRCTFLDYFSGDADWIPTVN